MPGVIYEATETDQGDDSLGGNRVYYLAWEVISEGPRVRRPIEGDSQKLNGVGYVAFGNSLTAAGLITGVGWGPEVWLNWEIGQWIITPTASGGDFTSLFADRIHWSFSPGTEVHFYVFGDNV